MKLNSLDYLFNNLDKFLNKKRKTRKDYVFKVEYKIERYRNNEIQTFYKIDRKFNQKNSYSFYKLGIEQPPPKRIVIKGFDD